jgi:acyl-coenzyme A thioesterase PaaI-like protein
VFAAAGRGDELIAEARPLHVGRSTTVLDVKITRDGELVANFVLTQLVLRPNG